MPNTKSLDLELSSSQYASITDASQTGLDFTSDFTIEAWIKLEQLPSTATTQFSIVSKYDWVGGKRSYDLEIGTDNKLVVAYYDTIPHYTSFICNKAFTSADVGVWHHVAVSVDISARTCIMLIDGSLVATTMDSNGAVTLADSTAPFLIGAAGAPTAGTYFDGLIDEVRIWNTLRTATQIQENSHTQLLGTESGLVGYWKFNDSALDETSNNNDLTLNGSPAYSTDVPNFNVFFSDSFDRTDSATVDGDWTESDASAMFSIYSNKLRINENADQNSIIYTGTGFQQKAIKITFTVTPIARANNSITTVGTLGTDSGYTNLYGVALGIRSTGKIWWTDNGSNTDETNFTWAESTTYNVEVLIFPDYSGEVRVWDSAGSRPTTATLTHAAETPTAAGTYYKIGHDNGAASTNDIRIDNLSIEKLTLSNGLISYWKLDESSGNAVDSVGDNDLTNNNSVAFATGKINNGIDLEKDSSQYMAIADASQTGLDITGDFTISAWIKVESAPANGEYRPIAGKYNPTGNQRGYYFTYFRSGGGAFRLGCYISDDGATASEHYKTQEFTTGTWYHALMTYDVSAGTAEFFINGSSLGTSASGKTSIYNNTADFRIGEAEGAYFDGMIDEVGIWNRILTGTEITSLYNLGTGWQYPFSTSGAYTTTLTEVITISSDYTFSLPKVLSQIITVSSIAVKKGIKVFSQVINVVDPVIGKIKLTLKVITEYINVQGSLTRVFNKLKNFLEAIVINSNIIKRPGKIFSQIISVTSSFNRMFLSMFSEIISVVDSAIERAFNKLFTENIIIESLATTAHNLFKELTEVITIGWSKIKLVLNGIEVGLWRKVARVVSGVWKKISRNDN